MPKMTMGPGLMGSRLLVGMVVRGLKPGAGIPRPRIDLPFNRSKPTVKGLPHHRRASRQRHRHHESTCR